MKDMNLERPRLPRALWVLLMWTGVFIMAWVAVQWFDAMEINLTLRVGALGVSMPAWFPFLVGVFLAAFAVYFGDPFERGNKGSDQRKESSP